MATSLTIVFVAIPCILLGIFFYNQPLKAIEIQRRFYEKINWKIEPISLPKEIRNTKLMGLSLVVCVVFALWYVVFLKKS